MRIAYLDCFSGISGDMFLGALVDAGVPAELLLETVRSLNVGAELEVSRVDRNGITATKVDVVVGGVKDMPREEYWEARREGVAGHSHEHQHEHSHGEGSTHSHPHDHAPQHSHSHDDKEHKHRHEGPHEHRGLKEIREIIGKAAISGTAMQTALRIFQNLGEAEAKIHNKDVETIHFHEVGSVDAIVDIVCAAVGAEALGVDDWHCSALNVGGGVVQCAHGTLPVPAPATLELLKNAPVYSSEIKKELVTPTGAAIVRTLVKEFAGFPAVRVSAMGYGAGARNFKGAANVVRLTVGEAVIPDAPTRDLAEVRSASQAGQDGASPEADAVMVIEANLDDMTPQVFGYVIERLLDAGALDAFGTPVQMKKSRPGFVLTALTRVEDAQRIAALIFAETTTIGIRMRREIRQTLDRRHVSVQTPWGEIRVKVAERNGAVSNVAPEFEDCKKIAVEHGIPLKTVMQEAMRLYTEKLASGD
ncbi:MAG TPA: nickel pincer cofactor biosynthesis protein LarC [Clostridia bacterium]|nr:nickel pincer cofactor biosynthesis protein LarC [Clostridia bacterium]